jgi:hypothetical protein
MRATQPGRVPYHRPLTDLALSSWIMIPLAILLGSFVAYQFFHLTPRYIKLVFAILFFLAVARLPFHASLAMFLVLFSAPTYVNFGDTNVIFIGVMTVIWIGRVRLGLHPPRLRTPIDHALLVYLLIHVLSFINISDGYALKGAMQNMQFMTAGVLFYVLLVNTFRTERHLAGALNALCVLALFVDVTAIAEYNFGLRLVPEWFLFSPALGSRFAEGGRAGGVFGFHGLLADFSAMTFYVEIVLGMRTRRRAAKLFYYGLAALSPVMIVYSANRGGLIIWAVGGLYFLWMYRHRVSWSKFSLIVVGVFLVVSSLGLVNQKVLNRLALFSRLLTTHFIKGVPENRVAVWSRVLEKIPEHLWLGHGPFIDLRRGARTGMFWPHNAYLFYLYTVGIVGLIAFLWILIKILRLSFPGGRVDFRNVSLGRATQAVFHIQVLLFALAQLRDEHQRGNVYVYYMWILFAFAVIGRRLISGTGPPESLAPTAPGGGSKSGGPA